MFLQNCAENQGLAAVSTRSDAASYTVTSFHAAACMLWRMRTTWRVLCGAAICVSTWIASAGAAAAAYPAPQEGTWIAHGVSFTSGESMTEVRLHYRTIGTPQRDGAGVVRNAVLILHGTGGAGSQFLQSHFADELFGPGQLLDATKYYLILPDNIGHGQSSKP